MSEPPQSRYSSHLFERIADSLPGQMAYWDKDLICRFANRAYLAYFARSLDEIVGISMQDLLGPDLFAQNVKHIDGALRGETQSFVRSLPKVDGSTAYVDVKYVPDHTSSGAVDGFHVSVNDVTAFKHIEARLRENEAELTALVARRDEAISWLEMAEEVAHVGHWRMSLPDGTLTWSDEMYRIHGVTHAAYSPSLETALAFHDPEDRARVQALMRRALTEGLPYEDVGQISRRDGEIRHVKLRGRATRGPDGSPVMVFGVCVDVTDQHKTEQALRGAHDRLEALANLDGLTGIINRRRFDELFDLEWRAALRNGAALSIVMIDVDRFKAYNDTYGHPAGDACLQAVARAIGSVACRPRDVVARYGGEEFVLLLPGTDRAAASLIAERARLAVEGLGRRHEGSECGIVTISAGVGSVQAAPERHERQRQVIAEADAMLYRAKRAGRNTVGSATASVEVAA